MNPEAAQLERRKPRSAFHLERMELLYEKSGGRTDEPHRHDYYTVLLIGKARGRHLVDFNAFSLQDREVHFVSPGQIHQVDLYSKPLGWFFTFSREFLALNNIPEEFVTNINLFRPFGESPPLKLDEPTFSRLVMLVGEMQACLPLAGGYRNKALGALLQLFLIYCHQSNAFNKDQADSENAGVCILRDFKSLVNDRYREWHQVSDYAAHIHITPKYLSQTVKQWTGKTAKELIQDRLLLESKRLLLHTDLSVKEVAHEVGFDEPLHFSGFFKKKAGKSPTAFREGFL